MFLKLEFYAVCKRSTRGGVEQLIFVQCQLCFPGCPPGGSLVICTLCSTKLNYTTGKKLYRVSGHKLSSQNLVPTIIGWQYS